MYAIRPAATRIRRQLAQAPQPGLGPRAGPGPYVATRARVVDTHVPGVVFRNAHMWLRRAHGVCRDTVRVPDMMIAPAFGQSGKK